MLDVVVLLPSFIKFFSQAIKHSSSPGKLASLVLAFGECVKAFLVFNKKVFIFSHFPSLLFLTDSISP